jgi:hypothetical protein
MRADSFTSNWSRVMCVCFCVKGELERCAMVDPTGESVGVGWGGVGWGKTE